MKTKKKEREDLISRKINELCDAFGENDRFLIFRKNGADVNIALPSRNNRISDAHVSASLATVINEYLLGDDDEGIARVSEIIIDAIEAIIAVSPSRTKLAGRFADAILLGMKMSVDRLEDAVGNAGENCGDCEFVRMCEQDDAIKYRKENGIPKPKKNKKKEHKVDVN